MYTQTLLKSLAVTTLLLGNTAAGPCLVRSSSSALVSTTTTASGVSAIQSAYGIDASSIADAISTSGTLPDTSPTTTSSDDLLAATTSSATSTLPIPTDILTTTGIVPSTTDELSTTETPVTADVSTTTNISLTVDIPPTTDIIPTTHITPTTDITPIDIIPTTAVTSTTDITSATDVTPTINLTPNPDITSTTDLTPTDDLTPTTDLTPTPHITSTTDITPTIDTTDVTPTADLTSTDVLHTIDTATIDSSTTSLPSAQPTSSFQVQNSNWAPANGRTLQWKVGGSFILPAPTNPQGDYTDAHLYLEQSTNRLMVAPGYYAIANIADGVFPMTANDVANVSANQYAYITCDPIRPGVPLNCVAEGSLRNKFVILPPSGRTPSNSPINLAIKVAAVQPQVTVDLVTS